MVKFADAAAAATKKATRAAFGPTLAELAAEGLPARALDVPPGTPLLHMDELGYDLRGHPVLHSDEYYADGILRHTVLRKKI